MTGIIASVFVVMFKFYFNNIYIVYIGIALLIIASIWNAWPRKATPVTQLTL